VHVDGTKSWDCAREPHDQMVGCVEGASALLLYAGGLDALLGPDRSRVQFRDGQDSETICSSGETP